MASNFFPMLSSSPPPIDDAESPENDDDDDEFGMYSARNVFESSFDSPVSNKSAHSTNNVQKLQNVKTDRSEKHISSYNSDCSLHLASNNMESKVKIRREHDNHFVASETNHINSNIKVFHESDSSLYANSSRQSESNNINCVDSHEGDKNSSVLCQKNDCQSDTSQAVPVLKLCDEIKDRPVKVEHESRELDNSMAEVQNSVVEQIAGMPVSIEKPVINNLDDNTDDPELSSVEYLQDSVAPCEKSAVLENMDSVNDTERKLSISKDVVFDSNQKESDSPEEFYSDFGDIASGLLPESSDRISLSAQELPDLNLAPFSTSNDNDDDFDDFQNADANVLTTDCEPFHNVPTLDYPKSESDLSKHLSESENEGFGNFESVKLSFCSTHEDESKDKVSSDDEFCDFETTPWDKNHSDDQQIESSSSDEFADFEAAGFEESSEVTLKTNTTSTIKDSGKGNEKISKVICAAFPLTQDTEVENITEGNFEILEQSSKSWRIWEKLHDNDQTPGLPFQWSVSHSFQQLLRSVNVDYHSILRTSTVPFFASGLGLLEPTKGTMKSESKQSENNLQNPKDPIPPVHFDWSSSGLINPLDSVQAASTLMDLTFISSSSTATDHCDGGKDFSFENELLKENPVVVTSESTFKPQILEQLLTSGTSCSIADSHSNYRPPNLSQEAVHVLNRLPDISFMRAKVLMFPVSNTQSSQ